MKVAVVYWSGTGNTEKMADCIAEGIENVGSEVEVIFSDDFGADMLNDYDLIAFGCPAMGDEVLEETSFEPMFEEVEEELNGRKIASRSVLVTVVSNAHGANRVAGQSGDDAGLRSTGSHISGNDLFIRVSANKQRVHEQEPIMLTYKVYTLVELTQLPQKTYNNT